jgi:hypothetical protein
MNGENVTLPALTDLLRWARIVAVDETKDGWLIISLENGYEVRLQTPAIVVHPRPN